jgi:hypothetical protein
LRNKLQKLGKFLRKQIPVIIEIPFDEEEEDDIIKSQLLMSTIEDILDEAYDGVITER